ncbi:MAG: DUF192 domain-containing protein [Myxococcales bacterium]|nr:DUF192 domain-containing protein [Myxococcales bacterium]
MRRLLALFVAIALGGCPSSAGQGRSGRADAEVTAEDFPAPKLPTARVLLRDVYGGARAIEVEVAATPASRTRGLMWRKSLPEGKGMLFVFPKEEDQGFWMKNTLIPLDMIFIGRDRRIVGIVRNAEPRSLKSRGVGKPSTYVLEVPGGFADKAGIAVGSAVELEGTSMIEAQP